MSAVQSRGSCCKGESTSGARGEDILCMEYCVRDATLYVRTTEGEWMQAG